ncbi:MAG: phosphodiester glycosidase family protein [Deltaproteobacteria bacterium]|nr:phosphodiester glycosidase family protein [Deltaproteobacteria bacterium]
MSTRYSLAAVVVVVAVVGGALPAAAADTWSQPFAGADLLHRVGNNQDAWVLKVDLCAGGIDVRATAGSEKGRTVSSFSNLVGAAAAINGDFFSPSFSGDGPAMHDGALWGGGSDHPYVAPIAFGAHFVDVPHHNNTGGPAAGADEVVSGHPTLLDDGGVVGNPGDPLCTNRHPRTALGISADHRTLILAVVDGRRTGAAGMTCNETAALLAEHGAFDAVNFDGGGSSTMVVGGAVKNRPSDGSQRTVGNHLAILQSGGGSSPLCPEHEPAGFLDRATCDDTAGWAADADNLAAPVDVHLYVGGPAGSGAPGFAVTANGRRDDLCGFLGCDHGFHFSLPLSLRDRQPRDVFAYAIDLPGGTRGNPQLQNAPLSLTCDPPTPPLIPAGARLRHVVDGDSFAAWGFDMIDVAALDAAVVDAYAEGAAFVRGPRLIRDEARPEVYVVDDEGGLPLRRHIVDLPSLIAWSFNADAIEVLAAADVDGLALGPQWPAQPFLLRRAGDPRVFVLDLALPAVDPVDPIDPGEGEGEAPPPQDVDGDGVVDGPDGDDGVRVIDVAPAPSCSQTPALPSLLLVVLALVPWRRRRA